MFVGKEAEGKPASLLEPPDRELTHSQRNQEVPASQSKPQSCSHTLETYSIHMFAPGVSGCGGV